MIYKLENMKTVQESECWMITGGSWPVWVHVAVSQFIVSFGVTGAIWLSRQCRKSSERHSIADSMNYENNRDLPSRQMAYRRFMELARSVYNQP